MLASKFVQLVLSTGLICESPFWIYSKYSMQVYFSLDDCYTISVQVHVMPTKYLLYIAELFAKKGLALCIILRCLLYIWDGR